MAGVRARREVSRGVAAVANFTVHIPMVDVRSAAAALVLEERLLLDTESSSRVPAATQRRVEFQLNLLNEALANAESVKRDAAQRAQAREKEKSAWARQEAQVRADLTRAAVQRSVNAIIDRVKTAAAAGATVPTCP